MSSATATTTISRGLQTHAEKNFLAWKPCRLLEGFSDLFPVRI
jgi:hypothetical protein